MDHAARIDVDRGDPVAINRWRQRLVDRRHLNAGSAGDEVYPLVFNALDLPPPRWPAAGFCRA